MIPWTSAKYYEGRGDMDELKITGDHIYYKGEPAARITPGLAPSTRQKFEEEILAGEIPADLSPIQSNDQTIAYVHKTSFTAYLVEQIKKQMREDGCHGLASLDEIRDMITEALDNG